MLQGSPQFSLRFWKQMKLSLHCLNPPSCHDNTTVKLSLGKLGGEYFPEVGVTRKSVLSQKKAMHCCCFFLLCFS